MSLIKNRYAFVIGVLIVTMLMVSAAPAEAQREFEPLFDKFNFKLEPGHHTQLRGRPQPRQRQDHPDAQLPVADRQEAQARLPMAGHQP
jgi:hypothetical protein